jgi:hypothetical protein
VKMWRKISLGSGGFRAEEQKEIHRMKFSGSPPLQNMDQVEFIYF